MTWLDIAIVVSICLCALYGLWKGIVRAVIGVVGLLGALLLAGANYRELAQALWPTGGGWTSAAAYAIIFFGVLIATALIAGLLSRLIHMTPLGIIDRALGLTAGLLVALLGWGLVLTILMTAVPGADAALADSMLAYRLIQFLSAVRGLPATTGGTT
ncbi:MAG: CvpA family protein [Dehalococcoidia bacterium]|nr:CvpA family protein [Dehalococcoidia bacterium]